MSDRPEPAPFQLWRVHGERCLLRRWNPNRKMFRAIIGNRDTHVSPELLRDGKYVEFVMHNAVTWVDDVSVDAPHRPREE
jgi:hypothetical protein